MKPRAVVIVALLGALAPGGKGIAQEPRRLQSLGQAEAKWTLSLPADAVYTLLGERVVALSEDRKRFRLLGGEGDAAEADLPGAVTGISASPRGDRLLAWTVLNEDEHEMVALTLEGRPLWAKTLGATLNFSPSGNFLFTTDDGVEGSQPPTVFAADTGRVAWQDAARRSYSQLAFAGNDTFAYYREGRVTLVDAWTGEALWERTLPAEKRGDAGRVLLSLDGRTLVAQTELMGAGQRVTTVLDAEGRALRESRTPVEAGRSNGGVAAAISPDGSLLAVVDLEGLSIVRSVDGRTTAELRGRPRGAVVAFTAEALVLDRGDETHLVALDRGAIVGETTVDQQVRFFYQARPTEPGRRGALGSYWPVAVETAGGERLLSALDLRIGRGRAR